MATVTMSVGLKQTAVTAATVGPGPDWVVQLFPGTDLSNIGAGDFFVDNVFHVYDIVAVDDGADQITVRNNFSTADPATGAGTVGRAYSGLGVWESLSPSFYNSGDTAVAEVYDDALISEPPFTIDTVVLGTSGTIKITVAAGERHNGMAGTGARWQPNAGGRSINFSILTNTPQQIIEWLEIIGPATPVASFHVAVEISKSNATSGTVIRNLIVHDYRLPDGSTQTAIGIRAEAANITIYNNLVYDFNRVGTPGGNFNGILVETGATSCRILNNTVHNIYTRGIFAKVANTLAQNNAVFAGSNAFEVTGAGTWDAASSNNAEDDGTAPGSSPQSSITAANQFVDLTDGSEDYHLLVGADCINNGADLASVFTDDIDGHTRITPWDIGADGVPFVATVSPVHRFVSTGVHRRVS